MAHAPAALYAAFVSMRICSATTSLKVFSTHASFTDGPCVKFVWNAAWVDQRDDDINRKAKYIIIA